MSLAWWNWLLLGLVLVILELTAASGFYLLFFGIGAIVVGLLAAFSLAGPDWMQLLLFSGLSAGSLVLFRRRLLRRFQHEPQRPAVDAIVGERAVALDALPPGGVGRVELRGTVWSARNTTDADVAPGARCRVVRVEGLTVHVKPEGAAS